MQYVHSCNPKAFYLCLALINHLQLHRLAGFHIVLENNRIAKYFRLVSLVAFHNPNIVPDYLHGSKYNKTLIKIYHSYINAALAIQNGIQSHFFNLGVFSGRSTQMEIKNLSHLLHLLKNFINLFMAHYPYFQPNFSRLFLHQSILNDISILHWVQ